jgi:hypothetical protein
MHRQAGRESEYDCFDATHCTDEWTMDGQTARISIWHRPLHVMIEVFTGAGFRITVISEPEPGPVARELFPEAIVAKPRFLCFLFFSSSCRRTSIRALPPPRHWRQKLPAEQSHFSPAEPCGDSETEQSAASGKFVGK